MSVFSSSLDVNLGHNDPYSYTTQAFICSSGFGKPFATVLGAGGQSLQHCLSYKASLCFFKSHNPLIHMKTVFGCLEATRLRPVMVMLSFCHITLNTNKCSGALFITILIESLIQFISRNSFLFLLHGNLSSDKPELDFLHPVERLSWICNEENLIKLWVFKVFRESKQGHWATQLFWIVVFDI